MRKQVLIGLMAVFTLLAATGCGEEPENVDISQQEKVNENPINEEVLNNSSEYGIDLQKSFEDYQSVINNMERSVEDCNKLEDASYKERCLAIVYTQLAEEKIDASQCAKIAMPDLRKECMKRVDNLKNPPVIPN